MEKNAHVELGGLPSLYVNPGLIKPLFFNLISNALKYSKKDESPVIQIYPEKPEKDGSVVQKNIAGSILRTMVLVLTSNMPNRSLKCFNGCIPKHEYEGTGIGLALCKQIVEKHKGFISALSKVNEGTTFIVSLPFQQNTVERLVDKMN